jgi:hypothetical protein
MSKARQLADLGNQVDDGAITGSNMVVNGAMTISQRGVYTTATSVSDNNYYLDRWKVWSGISATLEHFVTNQPNNSLLTKSARLTATSSATSDLRLVQPIEFPTLYGGQTMTLSAWIKTNSTNCRMYFYNDAYSTNTESAPVSNDEEWHYTTLTIDVASGLANFIPIIGIDGSLSAQVSISSGDYFEITGVCLNVGDSAIAFPHRSYGDELARCQRYYQTGAGETYAQTSLTFRYLTVTLRPEMRAAPTVVRTGNTISSQSNGSTASSIEPNYIVFEKASSGYGVGGKFTADAEL